MSSREKIAYLRGLIDGQKQADTPEKEKFYGALMETLESLAQSMEDHEKVHLELNDYLEPAIIAAHKDGVALTDDYFRTMYGIMKNNNNGTAKRY